MVRFIVSLVLLFATILGAMAYERGSPLIIIGISPLALEVLVPAFAMLAVWKLADIGHAFRDAFSERGDAGSRVRSVRIWDFTEKVCYAAGVIGFVLGAVLILSTLMESVAAVGRAFAVALLSPLYGVFLAVICRILKARVEK